MRARTASVIKENKNEKQTTETGCAATALVNAILVPFFCLFHFIFVAAFCDLCAIAAEEEEQQEEEEQRGEGSGDSDENLAKVAANVSDAIFTWQLIQHYEVKAQDSKTISHAHTFIHRTMTMTTNLNMVQNAKRVKSGKPNPIRIAKRRNERRMAAVRIVIL